MIVHGRAALKYLFAKSPLPAAASRVLTDRLLCRGEGKITSLKRARSALPDVFIYAARKTPDDEE